MKKAKAHVRYKDKKGSIVPGVTTICGILNKPALVRWANNLGLQGIDSSKYVSELADIGTLAHYMIQCHLQKTKPDPSDYSANQIDKAENAFLKYLEWEKHQDLQVIFCEEMLIHEELGYGGTVDLYCILNGKKTLVDFKTSKGIFPEHFLQVAGGYKPLLSANGLLVEDCKILKIGRDESEGFDCHSIPNQREYKRMFAHCLLMYKLKKKIGWK